MENESKALLMAATVLVGVLLISLAVYLFTIFGNFSADMTKELTQKDIDEFNAQFTKYESYQNASTGEWENTCRAQDIVTIANIAKDNNSKYNYTTADANTGYYYIKVTVKQGHSRIDNFEAKTLDDYKKFLKDYSGKLVGTSYQITHFKCTNIEINPDSKKVCSITFEQL